MSNGFRVSSCDGQTFRTNQEPHALAVAAQWVSRGIEHAVVEYSRANSWEAFWDVERDTKVDDSDPFYPVILHRRV